MQTICAIVLCGVLAAAVQPGLSSSNPDAGTAVTSVYALSFHPEVDALPPGAMYVCRARIMPSADAGQTAKGSGMVPGNQSGCALEVPFAWQANRPQPTATLSYEVDAVGADGSVLLSVSREGVALPTPMPNTKAHVELTF